MSDVNIPSGNRPERLKNMRKKILPEMKMEDIEDLDRSLRRKRMRRIRRIALGLLVVVLLVLVYKIVRGIRAYSTYTTVWENEEMGSTTASYAEMDGMILRVTMDGVTCLDTSGETIWNYGYSMRNPHVEVSGGYAIIADIQNTNAVIASKEGVQGTVSTTRSILNVSISEYGVAAIVQDDTSANYITFYDSYGTALDIEIKTILSGDGYPIDIALSPSGTGLVTSVVYLDQSQMQNQITFYNFDVGKSESNRVVGYFNCGDVMYPQVTYLTDTIVCAFGDSQMDFYSLKNESQPKLTDSVEFEDNIYSVCASDTQVAVVTRTEDVNRILRVYDISGNLKYEKEVDFDYTNLKFSNGSVVLFNSAECMILNAKGKVRYSGTLDASIRDLTVLDDSSCIVMGSASMKKVRFH